ncbi:MAG: YbjQ family protein [Candidatus Woesearchaeota archaeon]|jgi:uncharacterized protein YbjQ (UPF0145 family)
MQYVTTEEIYGKKIVKVLGTVVGNTVRARWFGADIIAGLRNIIGGEIPEYSKLMTDSREQAIQRMVEHAEKLGANAIVCVRFQTSTISQAGEELLVYGTAVVIK